MVTKLPPAAIHYITFLYKAILKTGYTPKSWRMSNVIFIPKTGKADYTNVSSFRPISLTTFLLKGLERVVLWHLQKTHFKKKPMIATQFAFLKGRSTETALSRTIDKIESALLRKSEALGVFLDIKGAFDNLDYEATLRAMRERGIPENITKWYGNLLAGRHASVTLDGKTIIRLLTRGTPQGGVLSPIIWNIAFETLLKQMSRYAFVTGFANDGCAVATGQDMILNQKRIQYALQEAEKWAEDNGLTFAPEKTFLIHFHRKHHPEPPPPTYLNGTQIEVVQSTKYLGVLVTHNLSWNEHIEQKIAKCKSLLFAARRYLHMRMGLKPYLVRYLWKACIRPVILYGSHLWAGNISQTNKDKLKTSQSPSTSRNMPRSQRHSHSISRDYQRHTTNSFGGPGIGLQCLRQNCQSHECLLEWPRP